MLTAPAHGTTQDTAMRVLSRRIADYGEELEDVTCPLCGQAESTLALEARDLLYNTAGVYRLVRCNTCSLKYVNPRPSAAALGKHYPDDYHCYRSVEDAPRWMRPSARLEVQRAALERMDAIERVIGALQPDLQILDVGCGRNALLETIQKKRGVLGLGIDMKPEMVEYVRETLGMPVICGTLEDAKLESGRFDLLTMINYLEHEPDPMRVLRESRRVLKPGGHIAIEIPDPEGPPARFFHSRWVNLDLPRHLVFFERHTMKRALEESGFELLSHERTAIPGYIGLSLFVSMGASNLMKYWFLAAALSFVLGIPFIPVKRFLPEFSVVIARAI